VAPQSLRNSHRAAWELAAKQHGVVTRAQLLDLGLTPDAIRHRLARGRLHTVHRGVYGVGRPQLTKHGWWMAAVLACGRDAVLSHTSAAELLGIVASRTPATKGPELPAPLLIHVSVPAGVQRRRKGIRAHRHDLDAQDWTRRLEIPVTSPARTLADLATMVRSAELETAINEADKQGLIRADALRRYVDQRPGLDGVAALRTLLDRHTFRLTDSELERRFLRMVDQAGLPRPLTQQRVNGFKVDFYWPELGLVVETDGLRYHRTPSQQSRDKVRDQTHAGAGLVALRFSHAQLVFDAGGVVSLLRGVAERQRLYRLTARS
jgi:very-short-patch-repair endonuclease/predicted transcriptional regulator of viral defense system